MEEENNELEIMIEELEEVILDEAEPDKKVLVGALLLEEERKEVVEMVRKNKEVFAWIIETCLG